MGRSLPSTLILIILFGLIFSASAQISGGLPPIVPNLQAPPPVIPEVSGRFAAPWSSQNDPKTQPPMDSAAKNIESIRTLQSVLNNKGFNAGVVNGVYGTQTRDAIIQAQRLLKMPEDGVVSEELLKALRQLSGTPVNNSVVAPTLPQSPPPVIPEVSGRFAAPRSSQNDPKIQPPMDSAAKNIESIRTLQSVLNNKGFNVGVVDGVYGTQTRDAIIQAQRLLKMPEDGVVSEELLKALRQLSGTPVNNSVVTPTLGFVAVYATQTLAYGYSYNFDNEAAANNEASKKCRFAGGGPCFLLLNKFGARCIAVARGAGGLGAAAEGSLSLTRATAIQTCQNYDPTPSSCKVIYEYCASNLR
jgi:peptidoglycan hydrolase-like protein with peptidoglycan-binding domain